MEDEAAHLCQQLPSRNCNNSADNMLQGAHDRQAPLVHLHTVSMELPLNDFTALLLAAHLGPQEALKRAQLAASKAHGADAHFARQLAHVLAGLEALDAVASGTPLIAGNTSILYVNKLTGWGIVATNIVVKPLQPLKLCSLASLLTWDKATCPNHNNEHDLAMGLGLGLGLGSAMLLVLLTIAW